MVLRKFLLIGIDLRENTEQKIETLTVSVIDEDNMGS